MDENLVILIVMVLFIIFLALGQNIASLLLFFGIMGIFLLDGWNTVGGFLENGPFYLVATYTLTTIPLYIVMSQFILHSGLIEDIFKIINKYSKGKSGILGSLTIVVGGLMGAVSGSGAATAATLGQVATPQLTKYGFPKDLAAAVSASGGSLAGLIPPSIILILYGSITQTSIGHLFIGAIIPGGLLVLVFILYTQYLYVKHKKKISQETPNNTEKKEAPGEEISVGRQIVVLTVGATVFSIIFVGIYSGVFTPNEAGGVAALVAFLTALLFKKVNWNFLKTTFSETIKVSGMILMIMIGAQVFGRFISLSLIPRKLIALLEPILEYHILIILILTIFYFFLFMFLETAAAIVMSVPVTYPIAMEIGLDPVWFGVFICIISVLGLLTPPVGVSTFMVASVTRVSVGPLFKLTTIYAVVGLIIVGTLITLFPELITWLPSKMN
ncbi:TRAP transporter large permease [Oceanobacillus damuensis]|uniref:TRAP transporter large permease n=1 Tax=Oceanobacillus damuensis TaxID=937928 RepID=UPI000836C1AF|nr:TRAP transporter large permease [Oceanobacillus damuensis]